MYYQLNTFARNKLEFSTILSCETFVARTCNKIAVGVLKNKELYSEILKESIDTTI